MEVEIEPTVLKWIIESSGWSHEEIIKKLKVSSNTLDGWLKGEINPTIKQLEDLSKALRRPLAAFFLSEPPEEKSSPKDYRMLPGKEGKFDKSTVLAIRRARRLQKISKELSENLSSDVNKKISYAKTSDSSKEIAEKYRIELRFNEETQKKARSSYEVFNFLRDVIEDKNILVFQIPMPMEDARGFALVDDAPSTIVVNSKDQIEARIFTLMHEFGHVLLNESGISMPENALFIKDIDGVERWCNDFASAFLLPESLARTEFAPNKERLTETKILNKLSRRYKVSKSMLLYNMSNFGYISKSQYESVLERYNPDRPISKEKTEKRGGFRLRADKQCLNEKGQKFVSLVVGNIEKGFITHSDALDYLSIKSKNLENVIGKARK